MLGKDSRFVEGFALGMWQANCYILGDVEHGTAFVVDPGQDGAPVVRERLDDRGVRCEAILLTHGHLDHIWSVPELARELDVPVLLHGEDRYLWDDPGKAFGDFPPGALKQQFGLDWDPPRDVVEELRDEQTLSFAGIPMRVRHTPGHTPGSSVFLITDVDDVAAAEILPAPAPAPAVGPAPAAGSGVGGLDAPLLLSGDLIFAGSVGRTDFPRGSWEEQMDSLKRVVLPLGDRTVILSGHGAETTVGAERAGNPFLGELR